MEYLSLFILLVISGFLSALETSLLSLPKIRLHHLADNGDKRALRLIKLMEDSQKVLSTILIANNLVNVLISAIATKIALSAFKNFGIAIATGLSTFFIVVFGEVIPKSFGLKLKEKYALRAINIFYPFYIIFLPITRLILGFSNIFYKFMGKTQENISPFATVDEFLTLVNVGEKEGIIEKEEKELISNVLEFTDTEVHEIMVPRIDMVCVSVDSPLKEVWKKIIEEGHSRIPVYEGSIDNIVGIVHAKDVLKALAEKDPNVKIKDILRDVIYVPENMKINELFNEMRKKKAHLAIVVDEYGGTAGLVTLEDVLEELVGEIEDEYDKEENKFNFLDENTLIVDAKMNIYELNDILEETWGITLPETEYDTLGGLILDLLNRVPSRGEQIDLGDLIIVIESVRRQRIEKVKIIRKTKKEGEEEKNE
ncbi:HlyC/CorC family transporter [Dictyoglomus thermophilum]|uniref:HlyC/CorC family transporter n=1 Tax=Dictyoglomus thermophilum TaxID=14 RepID=A0A7V3ZJG1_DICTH|nr:HlyC/CorC family transporter [Dictyoglomus thermophilum]